MQTEKTKDENLIPKEQKKEKPKHEKVTLSRTMRFILFVILISVEFAINISTGLLSSASKNIKETLRMNDKEFGMFGTVNGLGRVIGSSIFIVIVNYINRKWVFFFFCFVKAGLLMCFKLTQNGYLLLTTRFFIGIVHMPPSIYIPVWIDQFSIQKFKTLFMTMVQVVQPTGKVAGYLLHIIFGENNWQDGFVAEGFYLLFVSIFVMFTPEKFFSSKLFVVKDSEKKSGERVERKDSKKDKLTVFMARESVKSKKKENKSSFFKDLKIVLNNSVLLMGILVRAILFGVNTALHYWISDYMRNALGVTSSSVIFVSYTIIAVSGPVGGVLASSFVSCFLGGYENKSAGCVLLVLHIITCCFGMSIPFMTSLYPFCCVTALYLVFSSAALPIVQGIIITAVSPKLKGTAFSIANLVTMLLTSGPAPFIYGVINDRYKSVFKGMAMLGIMSVAVVGIIFIVLLAIFRNRRFAREERKKKKLAKKKREEEMDIAADISAAVNDASLEISTSINRSREDLIGSDESDEGADLEMKTKG